MVDRKTFHNEGMNKQLLTTHETASELLISEDTLRRWLREGVLPGIKLPSRAGWRVRRQDLEAWIEKNTRAIAPTKLGGQHE